MWYYKVVIGILLFPWSLIFLPPATLQTAPVLPLTLPEPPAPALSADLDASIPQTS
jgi:hypothetical protein